MEQILSFKWYELQDILLPILICVVLPISIVAIVMSARKRSEELKTQRYIAALEKGVNPDESLVKDDLMKDAKEEVTRDARSKEKKSAREQFQGGCIVGLIGLAFIIISIACHIDGLIMLIPGAIMFSVGLGIVLTFFVGKKYKLDE